MRANRITLTLLIVLLALPFLKASGKSSAPAVTEQSLRSMIVENPDSVLGILDKMEKSKSPALAPFRINLLRALAYNEKRMFAYVNKYAREVIESDSIEACPKEKTSALTLLSSAQYFFGNLIGSIKACSQAMEIAHKTGNLAAELNVMTKMANTYFTLGDRKKGFEAIESIISKGADSDDVRVLANVSAAYGVKIMQLYTDNRFSEALQESQKRLAMIDKIDNVGGAPNGFSDQQRAYTYAGIAMSAVKNGNPTAGTAAYEKFMTTDYGRSDVGRLYIVTYLQEAGKYSTVLEYTKPVFTMFEGNDTINADYYGLLVYNARAQSGLGSNKAAFDMLERANVIKDSLDTREKTMQAQELATVFSLNEKQIELEKEKAESEKRLILLWSAGGVILLVIIILVILWGQFQVIRKHNRLAAQRIDELTAQHQKQMEEAEPDDENKEARAAFNKMEQTIINGQLFKDPQFNREGIIEATGLSRNTVIQLIQEFTGLTPRDYITKLRLEHSVKLIKEHPEWSIDGIAEGCGYVSRATYYSHFNKFYGITPAQYRKELIKEERKD